MESSSEVDNSTTHINFSGPARQHKSKKKMFECKPSKSPDKHNLTNHINQPAPTNSWLSLGTNHQVHQRIFDISELFIQQCLTPISIYY